MNMKRRLNVLGLAILLVLGFWTWGFTQAGPITNEITTPSGGLPVNLESVGGEATAVNGSGSLVAASETPTATPTLPSHITMIGGLVMTAPVGLPVMDILPLATAGLVSNFGVVRGVPTMGVNESSGVTGLHFPFPVQDEGHNPDTVNTLVPGGGYTAAGVATSQLMDTTNKAFIVGSNVNTTSDATQKHVAGGGYINNGATAQPFNVDGQGRLQTAGESKGTASDSGYISGRFDTNADCSGACSFPINLSTELGTSWCENLASGVCHQCQFWNVGAVNAMEVKFGLSTNDPIHLDPDGSTTPTSYDTAGRFVGDGVISEVFLDDIGASSDDTVIQYACTY